MSTAGGLPPLFILVKITLATILYQKKVFAEQNMWSISFTLSLPIQKAIRNTKSFLPEHWSEHLKTSKSSWESVSCTKTLILAVPLMSTAGGLPPLSILVKITLATIFYQQKVFAEQNMCSISFTLSLSIQKAIRNTKSFLPEQWSEHLKTSKSSSESVSCAKTLILAIPLMSTAGGLPL